MIAVDTNLLVYAHREELPKHYAAKRVLIALAESTEPWALPVFCVGEFLRLVTHRRLFDPPFTPAEACDALARVLGSPSLRVLAPGEAYIDLLVDAVREAKASGNVVFDAQIVALCREYGVSVIVTEDRDFERFKGLTLRRLE